MRRREKSAEQRRRGKTVTAAGGGRKEQFCGGEKERKEPAQATRRDYLDEWARYLPERSVGVRRAAPGAHAESQQMSTARTRVRGVTERKEAR